MNTYNVEYTDTFGGQANYSWVRRERITMPKITHYGYDSALGYERELMRRAKERCGLTGVRGRVDRFGDTIEFRPYRCATVMVITFDDTVV